MKNMRFLFYYAGGLVVLVIVLATVLGRNTRIAKVNRAKHDVKEHYLKGEYAKAFWGSDLLLDSLHVKDEAVVLNLSNASYLATRTRFHDNNFVDMVKADSIKSVSQDTAKLAGMKLEAMMLSKGMQSYLSLSDSAHDKRIASDAYNQMGVISCKLSSAKDIGEEEKGLNDAADFFRKALKKDPGNEFARYNYELLMKKIQYPDNVFKQANTLVNERKYREARDLIHRAVKHDARIQKKFPDFAERIQTIITIDSLSRS